MTNVKLVLHNNLKTVRAEQKLSQAKLADKVGSYPVKRLAILKLASLFPQQD